MNTAPTSGTAQRFMVIRAPVPRAARAAAVVRRLSHDRPTNANEMRSTSSADTSRNDRLRGDALGVALGSPLTMSGKGFNSARAAVMTSSHPARRHLSKTTQWALFAAQRVKGQSPETGPPLTRPQMICHVPVFCQANLTINCPVICRSLEDR